MKRSLLLGRAELAHGRRDEAGGDAEQLVAGGRLVLALELRVGSGVLAR